VEVTGDGEAELCADWWEWHRLSRGVRVERRRLELGEPEAAWTAYWTVSEKVSDNAPGVVALLVALNELAEADDDGMTVGVGELENLLDAHGDAVIDEVERSARQNPVFARAVAHVWISRGRVSESTENRLRVWMDNPIING
jgi:hypothetical protein